MSGSFGGPSDALPAVSLRLAGEVGQTALVQVASGGPTALAELDQHVAAVRAAITASQAGYGRRAAAAAARSATDARIGPAPSTLGDAGGRCPDAPFAADAVSAEPALPLELLLHYVCGFLEEAVSDGWWPARDTAAACPDWQSMRLAAACQLIDAAEAAAQIPPDLYS
jgi:Family of unknown function (DUF6401)